MRLVNNFEPTSPEGERQIGQFEQNVSDEFDALEKVVARKLIPTSRKTSDYQAKLGEIVMVDTLGGDVTVTLPVSSPRNVGSRIVVVMLSASNTCHVKAIDGSATINLTTSVGMGMVVGLTIFYSAGIGWFS